MTSSLIILDKQPKSALPGGLPVPPGFIFKEVFEMFGKEKRKNEEASEPEGTQETEATETIEAKQTTPENKEKSLTQEEKDLLKLIEIYKKKYDGTYNAHDFMGVDQKFVEAEKLNVSFAIYAEIVELRKDLRRYCNERQN